MKLVQSWLRRKLVELSHLFLVGCEVVMGTEPRGTNETWLLSVS